MFLKAQNQSVSADVLSIFFFEVVSPPKTLHSVLIIINENQELDNNGLRHSSLEKQWLL